MYTWHITSAIFHLPSKNYYNLLKFDEVLTETIFAQFFLRHRVYIYGNTSPAPEKPGKYLKHLSGAGEIFIHTFPARISAYTNLYGAGEAGEAGEVFIYTAVRYTKLI